MIDAPRRPVVCHFIERLDHGGGEMLVYSLATRIREAGYEPIVCCLQRGAVADLLERDGVPVVALGVRRRSALEGAAFVAFAATLVWRLAAVIRQQRVSIVHAHLPDSIIAAAIAGRLTGAAVVGTYHGLGVLPARRARIDPRNAIRRKLYRAAARLSARTTAVSTPVYQMLCAEFGFDPSTTVLLVNGVDCERFGRAIPDHEALTALGITEGTVIVCVGRLVAGKGQRFLVDAMPAILERVPSATLLLVGAGPERSALEERVRALGLQQRVCFAGERPDVPALLAAASLFVLPSLAEGIPLALLEAMAAGKPVVATAVPGNLDVIVDERYGRLVPAADSGALAAAVCALLADPAAASAMAARGRRRVQQEFDLGRAAASLASMYTDVLAERRVRQARSTES